MIYNPSLMFRCSKIGSTCVASEQENPFPKIRFVCFTGSLLCLIKFQIQKGAKSAV